MVREVDETAAFAAVATAVSQVMDLDVATLRPDSNVADLGIDSMDAADIVLQVQAVLDVDIDLRSVANDWSGFTLSSLGRELVRCVLPPTQPG